MDKYLNSTNYNRIEKHSNFTVISNHLINNKNLNAEAKIIMIYILSKPDTWIINQKEIINSLCMGRKLVEKGFKCLIDNNYIEMKRSHSVDGTFCTHYEIYEDGQNKEINQCTSSTVVKVHIDNTESIKANTNKRYTLNEMKDKLKHIFKTHNYDAYSYTKKDDLIIDRDLLKTLMLLDSRNKQEAFLLDVEKEVIDITSNSIKQTSDEVDKYFKEGY